MTDGVWSEQARCRQTDRQVPYRGRFDRLEAMANIVGNLKQPRLTRNVLGGFGETEANLPTPPKQAISQFSTYGLNPTAIITFLTLAVKVGRASCKALTHYFATRTGFFVIIFNDRPNCIGLCNVKTRNVSLNIHI